MNGPLFFSLALTETITTDQPVDDNPPMKPALSASLKKLNEFN
jgi:hypothetical protein